MIQRDSSRVRRYFDAGAMPEPDEIVGDKPAWRESTILAWWATKTSSADLAGPRYRRPFTPAATPGMIAEWVLPFEGQGWSAGHQVHVRVFTAMDGGGPVVILQLLDGGGMHYNKQSELLITVVQDSSPVDLDVTDPQWIWLETYPWGDLAQYESVPPKLDLWDLNHTTDINGRSAIPTELDLLRMIGMPLDVFPPGLHTRETIAARTASGNSAFPTPILTDEAGIERVLNHLHTLSQYVEQPGPYRCAAAILADCLSNRVDELDAHARWVSSDILRDHRGPAAATLAVVRHPRTLSPDERGFLQKLMPATPYRVGTTPPPADSPWHRDRAVLRPGVAAELADIRLALLDPNLGEADPLRAALAAAEDAAIALLASANPQFRQTDRAPELHTYRADSPEVAGYLATLQALPADAEKLPRHLVRRARALVAEASNNYRPPSNVPQLWWDPAAEVMSCTYVVPAYASPPSYRTSVVTPPEPSVTMEWPATGALGDSLHSAGARLVAPSSDFGVYRPLFLVTNHAVRPVPGAGQVVWGVSSTDTLSRRVHRLFSTMAESNPYDWAGYPALKQTLLANGSGSLDVPVAQIMNRYSERAAPAGPQTPA